MSIIISDINAYAVDDTNAIWENGKIVTDERIFEKEIDEISYLSFAKERKEFVYHYVLDQDYVWSLEGDGTLQYWLNGDFSTLTVYKTGISSYYAADNCVYYSDYSGEIRKTDYSGKSDEYVYQANATIKEIVGNDEYLFFLTGMCVWVHDVNIDRLFPSIFGKNMSGLWLQK